ESNVIECGTCVLNAWNLGRLTFSALSLMLQTTQQWFFSGRLGTSRFAALPQLLVGTVLARQKLSGTSAKGNWEIFRVDVRGYDGRVAQTMVNDPAGVPPVGEFVVMPVMVGSNGYLREAKQLNSESF